jgi:hypothetical protein
MNRIITPQQLRTAGIEIINPHIQRGKIRYALFDFDGTVSLIREGWQGIMIPMMVELLKQTPQAEDHSQLEQVVRICNPIDRQTNNLSDDSLMRGDSKTRRRAYGSSSLQVHV